ncbi:hypothetical protein B0H11DRAFT_2183859 [Mycena galericulata]|nr:hypothetical protein B0H11DRAFT_2183859 [Mycena galericulata]
MALTPGSFPNLSRWYAARIRESEYPCAKLALGTSALTRESGLHTDLGSDTAHLKVHNLSPAFKHGNGTQSLTLHSFGTQVEVVHNALKEQPYLLPKLSMQRHVPALFIRFHRRKGSRSASANPRSDVACAAATEAAGKIRRQRGPSNTRTAYQTRDVVLHGLDRSVAYEVTLKAINDLSHFWISNYMEVAEMVLLRQIIGAGPHDLAKGGRTGNTFGRDVRALLSRLVCAQRTLGVMATPLSSVTLARRAAHATPTADFVWAARGRLRVRLHRRDIVRARVARGLGPSFRAAVQALEKECKRGRNEVEYRNINVSRAQPPDTAVEPREGWRAGNYTLQTKAVCITRKPVIAYIPALPISGTHTPPHLGPHAQAGEKSICLAMIGADQDCGAIRGTTTLTSTGVQLSPCYIPSQKGKERPPGSLDVDASPEHPEEDRRFSCRLFSQHHSSEGYRKGCRVIRRMPEATGGKLMEADRLRWSPTQRNRLCGSGRRPGRDPSDRKRSGRSAWEPGLICDSAGDSEDARKETGEAPDEVEGIQPEAGKGFSREPDDWSEE